MGFKVLSREIFGEIPAENKIIQILNDLELVKEKCAEKNYAVNVLGKERGESGVTKDEGYNLMGRQKDR